MTIHQMKTHLCDVFEGFLKPLSTPRLHIKSSQKENYPLALNDILFGHSHPAATSRYQISILSHTQESIDKHKSSGLWIATPAGSTAAIASYKLPILPLTSQKFLLAIRERYFGSIQIPSVHHRILNGQTEWVEIICKMRQGLLSIDGPDDTYSIVFGQSLLFSLPQVAHLWIIPPISTP
jgi:NAD+ kinase